MTSTYQQEASNHNAIHFSKSFHYPHILVKHKEVIMPILHIQDLTKVVLSNMILTLLLLVLSSEQLVVALAPATCLSSTASSPACPKKSPSPLLAISPVIDEPKTTRTSSQTIRLLPFKREQRSLTPQKNDGNFWELRLYNDEANYEFWVAEQLVKIAGLTERQAFDTMKTADAIGEATIGSYECFELGEYYHEALRAEGLAVKLLPVHS